MFSEPGGSCWGYFGSVECQHHSKPSRLCIHIMRAVSIFWQEVKHVPSLCWPPSGFVSDSEESPPPSVKLSLLLLLRGESELLPK